jgi:hypothetical protein
VGLDEAEISKLREKRSGDWGLSQRLYLMGGEAGYWDLQNTSDYPCACMDSPNVYADMFIAWPKRFR